MIPTFTDEVTKAAKESVTCPGTHNNGARVWTFVPLTPKPSTISISILLSPSEVGCKHTKQQEVKDEISWDGVIGLVDGMGWREGGQTSGLGLIVPSGLFLG